MCLLVCSSVCLSFSGSIDRRMSCLKWRRRASAAADEMRHPFVTRALSDPRPKALLPSRLWSPTAPPLRATLTCVCWRRTLCADALTNLLNTPPPPPTTTFPASIGGCGGAGGGGGGGESAAPLKDSCPSPHSSHPQCPCSTAQLTSSFRRAE